MLLANFLSGNSRLDTKIISEHFTPRIERIDQQSQHTCSTNMQRRTNPDWREFHVCSTSIEFLRMQNRLYEGFPAKRVDGKTYFQRGEEKTGEMRKTGRVSMDDTRPWRFFVTLTKLMLVVVPSMSSNIVVSARTTSSLSLLRFSPAISNNTCTLLF